MKNFKVTYTVGTETTIKTMSVVAETAKAAMAQLTECDIDDFHPIEAEEICGVIDYKLNNAGLMAYLYNGDTQQIDMWEFAEHLDLNIHQLVDEMLEEEKFDYYCKQLDAYMDEVENRVYHYTLDPTI